MDVKLHPEDNSFFITENIDPSSNRASWTCLEFGPVVVTLRELVRDYGVYLSCSGEIRPTVKNVQKFKLHLVDPSDRFRRSYLLTKVRLADLLAATSLLELVPDTKRPYFKKVRVDVQPPDQSSKSFDEILEEKLRQNQEEILSLKTGRYKDVLIGNQTITEYLIG
jgi:hypothetical protein